MLIPLPPNIGKSMHVFASSIYHLPRSLTGNGVRQTLTAIKKILPDLQCYEVPSGSRVFDWTVPDEWNLLKATLRDLNGNIIINSDDSFLHVLGYSEPFSGRVSLSELVSHLYFRADLPHAIPYVTSYYEKRWGMCLSYDQFASLQDQYYDVDISVDKCPGSLTLADLVLTGTSEREILFSTYICHPDMANNELSGPTVATFLASILSKCPSLKYTYRFVFCPETIGSLCYIYEKQKILKSQVDAGFVLTCIGDDGPPSVLTTINSDTLPDRAACLAARSFPQSNFYDWSQRGSDERQYCSPLLNLPVVDIMKSKYGEYPEYHTSLDDMSFVTPNGLSEGLDFCLRIVSILESNCIPKATIIGEPMLSKRDLYPSLSTHNSHFDSKILLDVFHLCDGNRDLIEIASRLSNSFDSVIAAIDILKRHRLIEIM